MNINNLFLYLFYAGLSFLVFLIDSYIGLLSAIFGYIFLFFLNYRNNGSIFNHIQFYLIACWILSITQIFNLYNFDETFFYDERFYFLCCVIITGLISTFFEVPAQNLLLFQIKKEQKRLNYLSYILVFLWVLSILSIDGFFGGVLQYIFRNLLIISPIIVASILYLNFKKKLFPNIIFFLTFLYYTSIMFNRTGFLLVPLIFIVTILIEKEFKINFIKNSRFIFGSLILVFFTLVIADIYKGSNSREGFIGFFKDLKISDFENFSSNTRYQINPTHNIYDYFSILDALTDEKKELKGNIFYQYINAAKPRLFFPEKQITNISELNYLQGYVSNKLFFAIFIESSYNLGLIGVFLFHLLLLLVGKIMFNSLLIVKSEFLFKLFSVHYFFYIISMYTLIRGPGIHLVPYFFICFCIMVYILYLSKKTSIRKFDQLT